MRPVWLIGGIVLAVVSIPSYYYAPNFLTQAARNFVSSMTAGNSLSSVSMLHQMGYPHLSVVIAAIQYLLIGLVFTGICFAIFGFLAKKRSNPMTLKIVSNEQHEESHVDSQQKKSTPTKIEQTNSGNEQVSFEVVNDVLSKLETQLKDIKTGYENHKHTMEEEKRNLEQRERERMAKIITTGEILIKEITPDRFEERAKYYIELKNDETGQPIDLSLLAEKFETMKKRLDSNGKSDLTSSEFDSFRKFLE